MAMQLHASCRCTAQQSQLMLQHYSRGVMETLGFGWRSFGAVLDSGHCICSPSAQGTVALEVGGEESATRKSVSVWFRVRVVRVSGRGKAA